LPQDRAAAGPSTLSVGKGWGVFTAWFCVRVDNGAGVGERYVRSRTDENHLAALGCPRSLSGSATGIAVHINANSLFGRFFAGPPSAWETEDPPPDTLEWRLLDAQQFLRPGFMTLAAERRGGVIVDFRWTFASSWAGRMLGRHALGLPGRRLRDVLTGNPGRETVFEQYRCVVELGAARATQQVHRTGGAQDTIRHGAVRLSDGVAVTLINVSAARRAHEVALALQAQRAMAAPRARPRFASN
jgi:hypothetical protein